MAKTAGVTCVVCSERTADFVPAKRFGTEKRACVPCGRLMEAHPSASLKRLRELLLDQEDADHDAAAFVQLVERVLASQPHGDDLEACECPDAVGHILREHPDTNALPGEVTALLRAEAHLLECYTQHLEEKSHPLPESLREKFQQNSRAREVAFFERYGMPESETLVDEDNKPLFCRWPERHSSGTPLYASAPGWWCEHCYPQPTAAASAP